MGGPFLHKRPVGLGQRFGAVRGPEVLERRASNRWSVSRTPHLLAFSHLGDVFYKINRNRNENLPFSWLTRFTPNVVTYFTM